MTACLPIFSPGLPQPFPGLPCSLMRPQNTLFHVTGGLQDVISCLYMLISKLGISGFKLFICGHRLGISGLILIISWHKIGISGHFPSQTRDFWVFTVHFRVNTRHFLAKPVHFLAQTRVIYIHVHILSFISIHIHFKFVMTKLKSIMMRGSSFTAHVVTKCIQLFAEIYTFPPPDKDLHNTCYTDRPLEY